MDVLVTGGTGVLGRAVVDELVRREHRVRVLTRRVLSGGDPGPRRGAPTVPEGVRACTGDISTGIGLSEALSGVDAVVHAASDPRRFKTVDVPGTKRLVEEADKAGEPHLIYISIVGCDQIPYGYYRVKTLCELTVTESGLPWTVLRTTQFHDLMFAAAYHLTRSPLVPLPRGLSDQPISVLDVAPTVAELVESGPVGRATDMGGPEVLTAEQIFRSVAEACGRKRIFVPLPAFGRTLSGFREGHHLTPEHAIGTRTFADFVAAHVRHDGAQVTVDVPYRR